MRQVIAALGASLHGQADRIHAGQSCVRARKLCDSAPPVLCMLAEPWLVKIRQDRLYWQILEHCAWLHLYARLLDDALDEDRPEDRLALLRAQPLFWQCACWLTRFCPHLSGAAQSVLEKTVHAVEIESPANCHELWGAKNGHLLLLPLYLARDAAILDSCGSMLLDTLTILQAGDECGQGAHGSVISVARLVQNFMDKALPDRLHAAGWFMLADRMCEEAKRILRLLRQISLSKL